MSTQHQYPPPDTFLLELIDQVVLAFPNCLQTAKIHFSAIEGSTTEVGLTDLEATPLPDLLPRIDLGHQEEVILDSINAILGDLAKSVKQHGDIFITKGYWDIFPDDVHGGTKVFLVDNSKDDEVVRMKRTFDKSELSWLLFTPEFFRKVGPALPNITKTREAISSKLAKTKKYELDLQNHEIRFHQEDHTISYDVEVIGSYLEDTGGFLWGWANPNCPEELTQKIQSFKEAHQTPGLRLFYKPEFGAPESMGHQLCEYAATYLNFEGVYKVPFKSEHGNGFMYLGLQPSRKN